MSEKTEKAERKTTAEGLPVGTLNDAELDEWADAPPEEDVRIGKRTVRIRAITDSYLLTKVTEEAKARLRIPIVIDGQKVDLSEGERFLFTWLVHGIVTPKVNFAQLVQISRRAGADVVMAAKRLLELSGADMEAVDVEKKGSNPEAGNSAPIPDSSA